MKATILYKLNTIARLRLFSGMKDDAICNLVQLSRGGLSRIIALPEYQELERQLLEGGINKLDEAVAGKAEEMKKLFAPAVPAAMRTLIEAVTQRRDLRTAVTASIEVLDRDPDHTFAKATRSAASEAAPFNHVPQSVLNAALAQSRQVADSQKPATPKGVVYSVPPDEHVN